MKRSQLRWFPLLLGGLLLVGGEGFWRPGLAQVPSNACEASLGSAIDQVVNRPEWRRSRWGIFVQTLATSGKPGTTLYRRDADRFFTPASNVKLLTTAAALIKLTPDYRIRTSVYRVAAAPEQTVLRVVGRGDPSLTQAQLTNLAQQLKQKGIQRIDRLLLDGSYFPGSAVNPNWEWEDVQAGYGAPVNSLIWQRNALNLTLIPQGLGQPLRVQWEDPNQGQGWAIANTSRTVATTEPEFVDVGQAIDRPVMQISGQLRVGSEPEDAAIAILNPDQFWLQQFRQALANQKISVGQAQILQESTPQTAGEEIAAIASPPLSELLVTTNHQSQNLYAEALLKTLGRVSDPQTSSATDAGLAAIEKTLTAIGVNPEGYHLVDGSGLARQNLVTPEALVQTLQAIAQLPNREVTQAFQNSLSVAGQSGTLSGRFRGTVIEGKLQGKTGAMQGVAALSGYLNRVDNPLVFTIIINQSDQSLSTLRQAIDEIVVLLGRSPRC